MNPKECTPGTKVIYQPNWAGGQTVRAVIEKEKVPLLTYLVRIIHNDTPHPVDTDIVAANRMDPDLTDDLIDPRVPPAPEQAPTADDARADPNHATTWRPKGGWNRDNTSDERLLTEDTVPNDEWDRIQKEHGELFRKRRDLAMILQGQANDVLCGLSFELPESIKYAVDMDENTYKLRRLALDAFKLVLQPPKD